MRPIKSRSRAKPKKPFNTPDASASDSITFDVFLTSSEVAERLRCTTAFLQKLWKENLGPPRLKIGAKVLVLESDLQKYTNALISKENYRRSSIINSISDKWGDDQ